MGGARGSADSIRAALRAPTARLDELSGRLRNQAADYDIDRLVGQVDGLYDWLGVRARVKRTRRLPGETGWL
jgi:hypothetical protein